MVLSAWGFGIICTECTETKEGKAERLKKIPMRKFGAWSTLAEVRHQNCDFEIVFSFFF